MIQTAQRGVGIDGGLLILVQPAGELRDGKRHSSAHHHQHTYSCWNTSTLRYLV